MKILLLSFPEKNLINPPLGLAYIAAMLNKNGHQAIISEGNNKTVKDQIKAANIIKPDIVGISISTPSRMNCFKIAKGIKKALNLPIVLGGPHATLLPDQILQNYPFIDYVVRGEGEYVCLELLNALENKKSLDKIKSLSFRKEGKIIHNPLAGLIEDLDALPLPEYKFFNLKGYANLPQYPEYTKKYPVGHIHSSRGCPHNCTFCSTASLWGHRIRFRSAENVIEDVERLHKEYGVRYICFMDDHFLADKKRIIKICKLMIEKGLDKILQWQCNSEVNIVNEEILGWMKKAGCVLISYGVEDASEEGLKFFKKAHNQEQVIKAFELTKKAGIKTLSFFIIGGDHESPTNILKKKQLIKKLDPYLTSASILVAFPGTEIFERGRKNGWWDESIFLKECVGKQFYSGAPIYPSKNISLEERFEATAGIDYWWNSKKGNFKFKDRVPAILTLIKNKDFAKIYSMGKIIIAEFLKK